MESATENVDETPTGKLMKNIIATFAQFENDVRSERTINGIKEAVQEGRWCWKAPIGYINSRDATNKPTLTETDEAKYVKMAFELAESGLYSQAEIVEILNKKGFNRASRQLINRILNNPLYAGIIKIGWFPDCIDTLHRPIVSKDTFYRVQLILEGKRPKITPHLRNNPDFPLRNFVRCSSCDQKLTGSWSTGRSKKKYPYYHCRTLGCSLSIRKEYLEVRFYNYLKSFQLKKRNTRVV